MRLKRKIKFKKKKKSFLVRQIETADITSFYVNSINKSKFLRYNFKTKINKKFQVEYVNKINESKNDIIMGIFNKNKLIGTCGAQKKSKKKYYLGIFIFNNNFRGLNLSKFLICFMAKYLYFQHNVTYIYASVNKKNIISHNLFNSLNFKKNIREKRRYKSDIIYFIKSKNLNFLKNEKIQ